MATQAQIKQLKNEITKLQNINENLQRELTIETNIRQELALSNESSTRYINNLVDALSRANNTIAIAQEMNTNLMRAIAVIGGELRGVDRHNSYHLCVPASESCILEDTKAEFNVTKQN